MGLKPTPVPIIKEGLFRSHVTLYNDTPTHIVFLNCSECEVIILFKCITITFVDCENVNVKLQEEIIGTIHLLRCNHFSFSADRVNIVSIENCGELHFYLQSGFFITEMTYSVVCNGDELLMGSLFPLREVSALMR